MILLYSNGLRSLLCGVMLMFRAIDDFLIDRVFQRLVDGLGSLGISLIGIVRVSVILTPLFFGFEVFWVHAIVL